MRVLQEYSRSERLVVQVENDLCSEQTIVVDETATKNATCLIELARPRRRPLERARRAPVSWNYTEEFHSCLLGLPALARTGENCWIAGCLRVEGGGVRRGGGWVAQQQLRRRGSIQVPSQVLQCCLLLPLALFRTLWLKANLAATSNENCPPFFTLNLAHAKIWAWYYLTNLKFGIFRPTVHLIRDRHQSWNA